MHGLKSKLKNKKILIYGFGKTGIASFKYLNKDNYLKIFDDNKITLSKKINKNFFIKKNEINLFKFDFIVLSPGIDVKKCGLKKYLRKNREKIITDLDIFYLNNSKNIKITITGTNGKSTTSKLLHEVLKKHNIDARLTGNIGHSVLLEKNIHSNTIFVIEASSYQIQYSKYFVTDFAVILNISPDHLERHGTIKNYINAKFKLIKKQKSGTFAFIQKNNKYLNKLAKNSKINSKIIKVSNRISKKVKKLISNQYFHNTNNLNNLAFVLAIAKIIKLKEKKIIEAVNFYKGLKYRQQIIVNNKKLLIINDSKSTSFSSSANLLQSYKNIFWLVGGIYKMGDKFNLEKKNYKYIKAYIFGKNKKIFKKQLNNKVSLEISNNIKGSLEKIIKDSNNNKNQQVVIFSPSGASFDQFKNFEDRGKYFNNLIKKINFIKRINDR